MTEFSCDTVTQAMHARIRERLACIERTRGVRVLYAVESGSRAWGMASADSDYDVRFIYARPRDWYLCIDPDSRPDTLDEGITATEDGVLDCSGWDVRKALRLLSRSNGAILEWLHSPIVYADAGTFARDAREAATRLVSLTALWHHYRHLRNNSLERFRQKQTAKVWLYALRPQLAMLWIERRRSMPPVEFAALAGAMLPPELTAAADAVLSAKKTGKESDGGFVPAPELAAFLDAECTRGDAAPLMPRGKDMDILDEIYRKVLEEAS